MAPVLKYSIYKGMTGKFGAVQFALQKAHFYCTNNKKHKVFEEHQLPRDNDGKRMYVCPVCSGTLSTREGCVFVDITSTKGQNEYDWDNKIAMSLSINDIGKILLALRTNKDLELFHDPGAKSSTQGEVNKKFRVSFSGDPSKGCLISSSEKSGSGTKQHTVPLSADETVILATLLQSVVPKLLSWV